MIQKFEFLLAKRFLYSKKKDKFISVISFFSLLGIILGVAALIIVMSVMNGFRLELTNKIIGFTGDINIYPSHQLFIDNAESIKNELKNDPEFTYIVSQIEGQVLASNKSRANFSQVRSLSLEDLKAKKLISDNIILGKIDHFEKDDFAILGQNLLDNLDAKIGDEISLISPQTSTTIMGAIPRIKTFKILASFQTGMYQYDNGTIFIPFEIGSKFFKTSGRVSNIEIGLKDHDDAKFKSFILSENYQGKYRILDWQTSNGEFLKVLDIERVVMFLILTLIILVAAFNIVSSLVMLVNDKGKEIAIMRTMGASRQSMIKIFILCGSMLGIGGTFLGIFIGYITASNLDNIKKALEKLTGNVIFDPVYYYLTQLPSHIVTTDIIKVGILSICLSLIATIYPAYKAANLDPAEGLRYE